MNRAHRAGPSLTHRVQHRDDLVAENLADYYPVRVHPQRPTDESRHPDRALALHVRFTGLECNEIGMANPALVETQLEGLLDRDHSLSRRYLRCKSTYQVSSCQSSSRPRRRCSSWHARQQRETMRLRRSTVPSAIRSSTVRSTNRCLRIDTAGRRHDRHECRKPAAIRESKIELGVRQGRTAFRTTRIGLPPS